MVDAADVLAVVAEASGIPAEHLSESDLQPLAELETRLRRRVAGQDGAVAAAVAAVRLGRLGLQRGGRPLASLLLTGPAGVGKATLCAALADALYGNERLHLLRFNLAEFADRASVSRLVGAPPGYVGYGDGGLLTEAVRCGRRVGRASSGGHKPGTGRAGIVWGWHSGGRSLSAAPLRTRHVPHRRAPIFSTPRRSQPPTDAPAGGGLTAWCCWSGWTGRTPRWLPSSRRWAGSLALHRLRWAP